MTSFPNNHYQAYINTSEKLVPFMLIPSILLFQCCGGEGKISLSSSFSIRIFHGLARFTCADEVAKCSRHIDRLRKTIPFCYGFVRRSLLNNTVPRATARRDRRFCHVPNHSACFNPFTSGAYTRSDKYANIL